MDIETNHGGFLLGRGQANLCFHFAGSGENWPDIAKSRDTNMWRKHNSFLFKPQVSIFQLRSSHKLQTYDQPVTGIVGLKSVQSSLSHLTSTSVLRATFTRFSWSMYYFNTIYIEQTDLGAGFHKLMNNLKPLSFRVKTFKLLPSMKSQLTVNS